MKMQLKYHLYNLPFEYPFRISKGEKTHQPGIALSLSFMGFTGYGEAPAISYYNTTVERMQDDLEKKRLFVEQFSFSDPERYWHYIHHLFPLNPFLVSALDMAGWDLYGKMRNKPLYQLWKLDRSTIPPTDYTIGIDTIDKMVEKLKKKSWPVYKIKMGVEGDMEMVEALRKITDKPFRVDANAGWTLEQALDKIPKLANLGVELIEQPLAIDNKEGMEKLFKVSPLPLIADESCVFEDDVKRCVNLFHGINIKLTKCSGITSALRMIEQSKKLGLKIMLGSMNETSIGSAAIAHLAPMADYIDMDGTMLITEDLATGLTFNEEGKPVLSDEPGLGVHVNAF